MPIFDDDDILDDGEEMPQFSGIPEDDVGDALQAFALFGLEMTGNSLMARDNMANEDNLRSGAFPDPLSALNYIYDAGDEWEDLLEYSRLIYDDGYWHWEIEDDTP